MHSVKNDKPQMTRFPWKKVLKISLFTFLGIFLLLAGIVLVAWFNRGQIEKYVLELLNDRIDGRIYVGKIDYTIFRDFPDLTIVLHDVRCVNPRVKDSLILQVKSIGFSFNFWDILKKNYVLNQLSFADGFLHMHVDRKGLANYEIIKPDTSVTDEASNFHVKLNQIRVKNVHYYYVDEYNQLTFSCQVDRLKAKGAFYQDIFDVTFETELHNSKFCLDPYDIIKEKKVHASARLQVNTDKSLITWSDLDLHIEDVKLKTQGSYNWDNSQIQSKASLHQTSFKELFSLLPREWLGKIENYDIKGDVGFDLSLDGKFSRTQMPSLNARIRIENGYMQEPTSKAALQQIRFDIQIDAKKLNNLRTYVMTISDFTCKLDDKDWKGRLKVRNLLQPAIKMELDGTVNLSSVQKWFNLTDFKIMEGNAQITFQLDDKFDSPGQIFNSEWEKKKVWADLKLNNVRVQYTDMPIPVERLQARLNINENKLYIDSFSCVFGKTDLKGKMIISPWINLVNSRDVVVDGQLYSKKINYQDLDTLFISSQAESSSQGNDLPVFTGSLQLNVEEFLYGTLSLKNIKVKTYLSSDKVIVENLVFQSLGGKGKVDAVVQFRKRSDLYNINVNIASIDIRELFYEFNNFDQTTITHDHIRGKADVKGNVAFFVSSKGEVIDSTIGLDFTITVRDGELIGYAPLNDLKKYLKDRDFENIRFDELTGRVVIADQTVYLNKMLIKSSVGNVWVEGWQTFDGKIEYHLEIKYSELKRKKIKSAPENEYGEIVRTRVNDPSIFILVSGTVDDPKFEVSKTTVKEIVRENVERQRMELKEAFQKEFRFKKRDTIPANKNKKPIQPGFKVEWEDE